MFRCVVRTTLIISNKSHRNVNIGKLRQLSMSRLSCYHNQLNPQVSRAEEYFKDRSLAIERLDDAYPHKFNVSMTLPEFVNKFSNQENIINNDECHSVAGRIISLTRSFTNGSETIIYVVKSEGVKIQVIARAQDYEDAEAFNKDNDKLANGDIVGIIGRPIINTELLLPAILVRKIQLLSPCLQLLPPQNSLNNEKKYYQRYLDLIVNDNARLVFTTRARITAYLRKYLRNMKFIEIETPIMNSTPSECESESNVSQEFVSYHDELNCNLFMRTSSHLYHQTLIGEGIDRVYEIGRKFNNKKMDRVHSSEYTTCDFNMAYADYNDLMAITEEMISGMVKNIIGTYKLQYHPNGPEGEAVEIDFTPPFKRIPLMETLQAKLNVELPSAEELNTPEANELLNKICIKHGIACQKPRTTARLLDKLVGAFLEETCINPCFITNHPKIISPFAKDHSCKPGLTEKFQLLIMKNEICNAYSVETNPFSKTDIINKEPIEMDKNICTPSGLGLPPLAGWILGVDRLAMILTDSSDIKDVVLFPTITSLK